MVGLADARDLGRNTPRGLSLGPPLRLSSLERLGRGVGVAQVWGGRVVALVYHVMKDIVRSLIS